MNNILAINVGSSSCKCALYDARDLQLLQSHSTKTLSELIALLPDTPLVGIGHRIVHGGTLYSKSTLINQTVRNNLKTLGELAPLHNGPAIEAIEALYCHYGSKIPQVAVFDTAFFANMPHVARYYAIPKVLSDKYGIYRFGFHGISHGYLWKKYVEATGKDDAKIITLHLGAGSSASAVAKGTPVDTSMGFTPNEGLVMNTRCGNVNPQVVQYLSEKEHRPQAEVLELLNNTSGLLGLSGISADMQMLAPLYQKVESAKLAIDLFCYRIVSYIGAYMAALGGLDAIVFSAGIGENAPIIRKLIIDKMRWYGIELDSQLNEQPTTTLRKISSAKSTVEVYVIPTDENHQIAQEVYTLLQAPCA